jgi:hypothetical protein
LHRATILTHQQINNINVMHYAKVYNLSVGDRIVVPLFEIGLSMHHAVYLGFDAVGRELIVENHNVKGVQIIDASEFFATVKRIERVERFTGNAVQRVQAMQRTRAA